MEIGIAVIQVFVVFKSLLKIHIFMGLVDLISAINNSEQQFMALLTKTYQAFHPLSPPEFIMQFIWERKILFSTLNADTLCSK